MSDNPRSFEIMAAIRNMVQLAAQQKVIFDLTGYPTELHDAVLLVGAMIGEGRVQILIDGHPMIFVSPPPREGESE